MDRSTQRVPWWLGGDAAELSEHCGFCHGTYAFEVEVRCSECDRASCPHCAVILRRHRGFHCVDCAASAGGS